VLCKQGVAGSIPATSTNFFSDGKYNGTFQEQSCASRSHIRAMIAG
jgi:hypothetical protein